MHESPQADYRVILGLCALTTAAVTPFFVYHLATQAWLMTLVTGGLVAFTLVAAAIVYRLRDDARRIARIRTVIVLLANAAVAMAMLGRPGTSIYWLYPAIFVNFYMLPTLAATAANLLVCGLSFWAVSGLVPGEHLARMAGSIPLCLFFGLVFSRSVLRQRRELHHLANHDALTGTGNRHGLDRHLRDAAERLKRYGETSTLVLLDMDHFKAINDSLGHIKGDDIIIEFARLLDTRLRRTDRLFRFGGEEFVVVLPHTSLAEGYHLAESLRVSVERHGFAHGQRVTTSGGVSELTPTETPDSWLDRADRALYRAKTEGRNRVVRAESATHREQ